jgi:hypothetical protein
VLTENFIDCSPMGYSGQAPSNAITETSTAILPQQESDVSAGSIAKRLRVNRAMWAGVASAEMGGS